MCIQSCDGRIERWFAELLAHLSPSKDAITTAARQVAQTVNAKAIVCFTLGGSTVARASQERPTVPILAITPFKETSRQLSLSWGVYPDLPRSGSFGFTEEDDVLVENPAVQGAENDDDFDMVLKNGCRAALRKGLVSDPNDLLVVTAGLPVSVSHFGRCLSLSVRDFSIPHTFGTSVSFTCSVWNPGRSE